MRQFAESRRGHAGGSVESRRGNAGGSAIIWGEQEEAETVVRAGGKAGEQTSALEQTEGGSLEITWRQEERGK